MVERRAALSPGLGQYWTELGKQILYVLSFFLSLFSTVACVYNCSHVDIGCLIILLHTSSIYWCDFSSNSQQLAPTVGQGSKDNLVP